MQFLRQKTSCTVCPLRDRRRIWSEKTTEGNPALAIIGEAPGVDEDYWGRPFVGASGKLLDWLLHEVDLPRASCYVGNVVCCRPTDNRIDTVEGQDAVANCQYGLRLELKELLGRGLKVVLALGVTAMEFFGISGTLTKNRGSVYKVDFDGQELLVVPTFHPSHVLQNNWTRASGGRADGAVAWVADARKARDLALGQRTHELIEDFYLDPTVEDVEAFVDAAIRNDALVAVDIETTGLSYDYAQIVVIGLAVSAEHALCVPILKLHGETNYTNGAWQRVFAALKRLFSTCRQVYQNSFFDVPLLRKFGMDIPYRLIEHDTMILHHTLCPEVEHNLGYIVSIYGATPYWKGEFLNKKTSILEMDQLSMRRYNLRDCVVLLQVLPKMLADLDELGLVDLYNTEVRPLIEPIMEMQQYGIGIDLGRVRAYKERLTKLIKESRAKLYALGNLPPEFNLNSDDQLRWFLYRVRPSTFGKIEAFEKKDSDKSVKKEQRFQALEAEIAVKRERLVEATTEKKRAQIEKSIAKVEEKFKAAQEASSPTKIALEVDALRKIRDEVKPLYLLSGYQVRSTDKGKLSVNKQGLLGYRISLNNRLAQIRAFVQKDGAKEEASIQSLLVWLDELSLLVLYEKLTTTYCKYAPWADGRIHARWQMHGTASGRLSCVEPNLQNPPKPREDAEDIRNPIRSFFVVKPGYKFVSCDYVNLEAQLLAFETLDPELCEVFATGANLHDVNTRALFGIDEDHPNWKLCRKAAKVFFFGGISYGGGDREIFEKVTLEAPGLRMTFAEFAAAKQRWMDSHPSYVRWKEATIEQVRTKRQVRTEFGRLRMFLGNNKDIDKEALNTLIQSSGASLVNRAMVRIYYKLPPKAHFVLQVHDQLVVECLEADVDQVSTLMKTEMERPFMYKGFERVIPVECAVGNDFGEL